MLKGIKIISIKKIGIKKTYDLNVLKNHNFFLANGILSHNCLEAQSFSETKGLVSGSQDLTLLCKMSSQQDIEDATALLYRANFMSKEEQNSLPHLKPGEVFFVVDGQRVKRRYFFLPRTMFWKPGYNFYNIWHRFDGGWYDTKSDKHELIEQFKKRQEEIKEKERVEKLMEEEKKKERIISEKRTKELEKLEIAREMREERRKIREEDNAAEEDDIEDEENEEDFEDNNVNKVEEINDLEDSQSIHEEEEATNENTVENESEEQIQEENNATEEIVETPQENDIQNKKPNKTKEKKWTTEINFF